MGTCRADIRGLGCQQRPRLLPCQGCEPPENRCPGTQQPCRAAKMSFPSTNTACRVPWEFPHSRDLLRNISQPAELGSTDRQAETKIFHSLVYLPNGHNGQSRELHLHLSLKWKGPSTWSLCCCSQHISRELDRSGAAGT